MAGEWAGYGISVNCISPGYVYFNSAGLRADVRYVATEMTTSHTDERSQAYARKWQDMTPFNRYASCRWPSGLELISRFAEPKEIGDLAVLMCSERNTPWMTGSDVVIDGGKFC